MPSRRRENFAFAPTTSNVPPTSMRSEALDLQTEADRASAARMRDARAAATQSDRAREVDPDA